jgi:hypothetical protein
MSAVAAARALALAPNKSRTVPRSGSRRLRAGPFRRDDRQELRVQKVLVGEDGI